MIYTIENTVKAGRKVKVLLNGNVVRRCILADTLKGKVRHFDDPPKVHKYRKRLIQRTKYGKVEVFLLET